MSTTHDTCEMPDHNPPSDEIKAILTENKSVAIVGLSDKEERDSNKVARYMMDHGYTVIPVNPTKTEILGQTCYPDLASIPQAPDIVDIFRKPDALAAVTDEAIKVGAKVVWMQLGLAHHDSAEKARAAGLKVVQGKCIKIEHQRMG